jgi:isopentenyl phosphate kinase
MIMQNHLIFLKFGGSLITDKSAAQTALPAVLARLAHELASALAEHPDLRVVAGHGSGSFGHVAAHKHGTRAGAHSPAQWRGFSEVWHAARTLNQIVVEAFVQAGLPVIAFPPSAAVIAANGKIINWDIHPLKAALAAGLLPLINGDTIFDTLRGGTILSTEELFMHLAHQLQPRRILLAGIEQGVWEDFPACTRLLHTISSDNYAQVARSLGSSTAVDVTGGMLAKVRTMLDLVEEQPGLEVQIFSGVKPGQLLRVLNGEDIGSKICNTISDHL